MTDAEEVYFLFNRIECFIWLALAVIIPFIVPSKTRGEAAAVFGASIGFAAFGITDYVEASSFGNVHPLLWVGKIACAAFLLSCRFTYKGWKHFRFSDPYLLFALFCLIVSILIMIFSHREVTTLQVTR